MVETSDKTLSPGEGKDKPLQCSCLENPMKSMKRQRDMALKDELLRSVSAQHANGEEQINSSSHIAAAAAAKLLQSCPTLCDPIDSSPPGSPVPGILQARILEWVAISFSNAGKWKVKGKSLSCVWLVATPWTAAYLALPSMEFSRQEYWNGLPLPSPQSHYLMVNRGGKYGGTDRSWKYWQILFSKITVDGEGSHHIRRWLLFGRTAMTNLDRVKSRDITLPAKVQIIKAMVFPVVTYGCESWTINNVQHQIIDAFELWCWRRLPRVPWTARRSNQLILWEINPDYSLKGLILKLKLWCFGHLIQRTD